MGSRVEHVFSLANLAATAAIKTIRLVLQRTATLCSLNGVRACLATLAHAATVAQIALGDECVGNGISWLVSSTVSGLRESWIHELGHSDRMRDCERELSLLSSIASRAGVPSHCEPPPPPLATVCPALPPARP